LLCSTNHKYLKYKENKGLDGVFMDKSIQKYFAMIGLGPEGSGKLYAEIMKWKQKPMEGIILEEAYQIFGEWDFAILFQADTNDNALHFVGDMVRPIEGVAATSTLPIAPIKDYRKT
jgi:hypothetical protein